MPRKTQKPGDEQRRRAVGERIREARMKAGIGQRQLARALGMSSSWLNSVEAGENGIDTVRLADVAQCLGCPVSHFLEEQEDVAVRARQLMTKPATRLDWQLMYAGEDERARAHFELDRVFRRLEEERGSGSTRPAGGD